MLVRVVARCYERSRLGGCSLWPLQVMAAMRRLGPHLAPGELLGMCEEVQRKNTYHPNYYEPTKEIFQNWPDLELQRDPRRHPFWLGLFLLH
jgi:hypothetical protein